MNDLYHASDYRGAARRALAGAWGLAVGVTLVAALLGGLLGGGVGFQFSLTYSMDFDSVQELYDRILRADPRLIRPLGVFASISGMLGSIQFIVGGTIAVGYARFCLHLTDGEPARFSDIFSAFDIFGHAFLLQLLTFLKIFAWALLFFVPGIVAAYRYAMAPFILAEQPQLTAGEAIERSKRMMDGHKAQLFLLDLSFIGWALLAALTMNIGTLWLNPYVNVSRAVFYRSVSATPYSRNI